MRYHLTLVRMVTIKKSTNSKYWRGCGEKGTLLHCWWECKLIHPLWKIGWRFPKKLEIELPYEPAIPLLGIHTKETRIERDACTPMFITTLFTIAKTWKQPRCPSADKWIRKLWYIYTIKYHSAIKKEHIWVSYNEVDETGAYYTEWSKPDRKTPIQYITAYIWTLEDRNDNPICKAAKKTNVKNRLLDSVGEGEVGMIWENSIETCT